MDRFMNRLIDPSMDGWIHVTGNMDRQDMTALDHSRVGLELGHSTASGPALGLMGGWVGGWIEGWLGG